MRDGRWTFFSIVNNILLAFHLLLFLKMLSASVSLSGLEMSFLAELTIILPPVTGFINNLFNHSVIRRNYHQSLPLSAARKNWQLFITLLFAAGAIVIIFQLISFISYLTEAEKENSIREIIFLRVLVIVYSVLSIYLILFQLLAARKAGSTPTESDTLETGEADDSDEEKNDVEISDDDTTDDQ
jgi:heme/copper-type cytochrome/quinol oxidase subunit 4